MKYPPTPAGSICGVSFRSGGQTKMIIPKGTA